MTKALESAATVILINKEVECPEGKALLISNDPFTDFNRISNHFKPFRASTEIFTLQLLLEKGRSFNQMFLLVIM